MALHKFAKEQKDHKDRMKAGQSGRARPSHYTRETRESALLRVSKIKGMCEREGLSYEELPDFRDIQGQKKAKINGRLCRVMAPSIAIRSGERQGQISYIKISITKDMLERYEFIVALTGIESDAAYIFPTADLWVLFKNYSRHPDRIDYFLPTGPAYVQRVRNGVDAFQYKERWDLLGGALRPVLEGKFEDTLEPEPLPEPEPTAFDKFVEQVDAYEKEAAALGSGVTYGLLVRMRDDKTGAEEIFLASEIMTDPITLVDRGDVYLAKRGSEYKLWYYTVVGTSLTSAIFRIWPFPEGLFIK